MNPLRCLTASISRIAMTTTLSLLSIYCADALAAESWRDVVEQRPSGTQLALVVQPVKGNGLEIHYRDNVMLPPASTQKLLTALSAELLLGKDYRFSTQVLGAGSQKGKNWQGNVRVAFSGAPDLSLEQLKELVIQLKRQGIQQIQGDLVLDGQRFSGYERAPGWPWDNLGVCYSAPASAFTLAHNCVAASLNREANSATARLFVPQFQPVDIRSNVEIVDKDVQQVSLCDLLLDRESNNRYYLHGCISNPRKVTPMNFAVSEPDLYVKTLLQKMLAEQGIRITGQLRVAARDEVFAAQGWKKLAAVESAPLATLLEHMLQHSDNLYADNIQKTLGAQMSGIGSFAQGARAIQTIMASEVGLNLNDNQLRDGSGLSRDNLLNAQQLSILLSYLYTHPQLETFKVLPVAGESGTLKYRRSLLKAPLKGNIAAKSGTLNGSRNLAGYITGKSGQRYLFVLMTYGLPSGMGSSEVRGQATRFEQTLLETVVNQG